MSIFQFLNKSYHSPKPIRLMLKYTKEILTKVSFDAKLFEKELKKALKVLIPKEIVELKQWCYANFGKLYNPVLNRCFQLAPAN